MIRSCMLISLMVCGVAGAQPGAFHLGRYRLGATFDLPASASEASAIAFRPDTGNLYVLGDEGDALVEVTRSGTVVSTMTMTGFEDTEGLTYAGGGAFVLVEERLQDAYIFFYEPGGSMERANLASVSLGETVGNIGLEGISYDASRNAFIAVKEKTPQAVLEAQIAWSTAVVTVSDLFVPSLGVLDLSDVQVLSAVPPLAGTADGDNLLIYSQESRVLLEVTRAGAVTSQFDFAALSAVAEGVTIDHDGVIYVCDETPRVYVLTSCYGDCNADGALTIADFACFQGAFVGGDPYADCDGGGSLTIADFGCFQGAFVAGCP